MSENKAKRNDKMIEVTNYSSESSSIPGGGASGDAGSPCQCWCECSCTLDCVLACGNDPSLANAVGSISMEGTFQSVGKKAWEKVVGG
jgi:hypothetical protein